MIVKRNLFNGVGIFFLLDYLLYLSSLLFLPPMGAFNASMSNDKEKPRKNFWLGDSKIRAGFFLGIILVVTVGITGIYFYPTGNNNFNRLSPPPPPYLPSAPVVTPVSFTIQECTQSFNIEENKPFTFKIVDPDLNYTYSNIITVSRPENGTLGGINQTDGHITYTPKIGFNGSDRFLFRVSENRSDRNTADICLNIRPK